MTQRRTCLPAPVSLERGIEGVVAAICGLDAEHLSIRLDPMFNAEGPSMRYQSGRLLPNETKESEGCIQKVLW